MFNKLMTSILALILVFTFGAMAFADEAGDPAEVGASIGACSDLDPIEIGAFIVATSHLEVMQPTPMQVRLAAIHRIFDQHADQVVVENFEGGGTYKYLWSGKLNEPGIAISDVPTFHYLWAHQGAVSIHDLGMKGTAGECAVDGYKVTGCDKEYLAIIDRFIGQYQ